MTNFSAPSFSLGLDLDFDSDLPTEEEEDEEEEQGRPSSAQNGEASRSSLEDAGVGDENEDDDEDALDLQDADLDPPDPSPMLKRLRRGPPSTTRLAIPALVPSSQGRAGAPQRGGDVGPSLGSAFIDDDIEEFSSQEDRPVRELDVCPSKQYHSVCGSSKVSLHGQKVLTTQSESKMNAVNNASSSNAAWSKDLEASSSKKMLPKLTISPLRKIQFLDSDSDDSSTCKRMGDNSHQKGSCFAPTQTVVHDKMGKCKLSEKVATEDLWKNFTSKKAVNIATPALDEFCEEYFSSLNSAKAGKAKQGHTIHSGSAILHPVYSVYEPEYGERGNTSKGVGHDWNPSDPQPPAYQYFLHDDVRIRQLVQNRLLNFIPLGISSHRGKGQFEADTLDYMCQFGPKEASSRSLVAGKKDPTKTRARKRNQSSVNTNEPSPSGNWVNPRSCETYPKDARKRRVHVESHSCGHWYTGQDGKKVYITKNGQELSGQAAYRLYRKECGAGFRKSKKKVAPKKTKPKR